MSHQAAAPLARACGVVETDDAGLLSGFVHEGDEAAFAELVRRQGSMVYGVCRRVLRHRHEAKDAFQATFLVLSRRAASISRPALLANWLYGVSYRVACRAREKLQTRAFHETRSAAMLASRAVGEPDFHEFEQILDDEIQRLPEKYRSPLLLCYLEGRTHLCREVSATAGDASWGCAVARDRVARRWQIADDMLLRPGRVSFR